MSSRSSLLRWLATLSVLVALLGCKDRAPPVPSTQPSSSARLPEPTPPLAESPFAAPAASTPPPQEVIAQHILIAYKGALRAQKRATRSKEEAKKFADGLRVRAAEVDAEEFTELVKKHSDDPAAIERLGSTGRFKRESMHKAFSDVAFALKVGEVSQVVETPFGFHIIKRNQ